MSDGNQMPARHHGKCEKSLPLKAVMIGILFASVGLPSCAQDKLDIVQIMGQFIQASYAASRCIKPEPDTLARFLFNYRMVSVRATEELKKRNPRQSEQQILEGLQQRAKATELAIDNAIREGGCSDPRIQDLLKRFEVQANLKF